MPGQRLSAPTFMFYGNATNVVVNGNATQTNLAFGVPDPPGARLRLA